MNRSLLIKRASLVLGLIGIWMIGPSLLWLAGNLYDQNFYHADTAIFSAIFPVLAILLSIAAWFRSENRSGVLLLIAAAASILKGFLAHG